MPRIAIVGRPNVGKSSLLNCIAGERVSIVDPSAGTTRDRVSVIVDLESPDGSGPLRPVEVVDTGGYGAYVADGERFNEVGADLARLAPDIRKQIAAAVSDADIVLFCIDAQAGPTPLDLDIAKLLREQRLADAQTEDGPRPRAKEKAAERGVRRGRPEEGGLEARPTRAPIHVVATKVDGPRWEAHGYEIASLGFGEPILVSAKSGYFRRDFLDKLYELLPPPTADAPEPPVDLRVAIIGKRNAGKSSLVNALAGEERVIVSEIAGTTRDAIDVRIERDSRSILLIDTAGLRRKKSFANQIEWHAFDRARRAIGRADVIFMLLDATEPASQVDEQLAMLVQKAFKPAIIVVNKWDLAEGQPGRHGRIVTVGDYETYIRKELKGLDFAPIAFVSAETGLNIEAIVALAFELLEQSRRRVTTGKLNRVIEPILARHNPPSKLGHRAKVFYAAQVSVAPPSIVLVVNRPELFTSNYQRFLMNRLREELPFAEVPIRLMIRGRKPRKDGGIDLAEEAVTPAEAAEIEREAGSADAQWFDDAPADVLGDELGEAAAGVPDPDQDEFDEE